MQHARHPAAPRPFPWHAGLLALLGAFGVAAAWVAAAMLTARPCAWMAVVAALDAAWLLRLGGVASGNARMVAGAMATLLSIALAQWGIASAHLAGMLGLGFLDTATRLGPSLAWTLSGLANGPVDFVLLAGGLVLAAFASR